MAIAAATVFEVRTGGSDNNGGGFVTGASGTDYSQQDAAQYALTTVTTAAANAICLDASAAANMVGNICQIISGTNFTPGLYQIISVSVGVSFTVDRTCTTAAGALGVINIGGAFASPGKAAAALAVDLNMVWVKAGTYTLTTATPGAAGPIVLPSAIRTKFEGYSTTRGDRAGRPVVSAGAVTGIMLFATAGADQQYFVHMTADGNSGSGNSGFNLIVSGGRAIDCVAQNCNQASQNGFALATSTTITKCSATACTTGFLLAGTGSIAIYCSADICGVGFRQTSSQNYVVASVATDCTDDGFLSTDITTALNCTSEGNAGDGFSATNNSLFVNCAATNNGGYGYNITTSVLLQTCASYNNTSGRTNVAPLMDHNPISLTGDPWVDAATDDLRPDETASEGALLRAAAIGVFGQVATRDIGAVQHSDPAGGGGGVRINPGLGGGLR